MEETSVIRFFQPADLAALPADRSFDIAHSHMKGLYFEVANVSGYLFELQDEGGVPIAIVGAFSYLAYKLKVATEKLTLHAIATQSSSNLPITSWAVYAGVTKNPLLPDVTLGLTT
jgi:hypothetical protein